MANNAIAVLEVGTTNVRVLVGELREDGYVTVVGIGETESKGIRKGEIYDRDAAIESVREALKAAEDNWRNAIHSVVLLVSGADAQSRNSLGSLRLVDPDENRKPEVTATDIEDVTEISRRVALNDNRIKMHTLQQYFQVDDMSKLTSPVGLSAEELRLEMLTIHARRSSVENFRKLVDDVPITCSDAVFSGLCAAHAVLNEDQKKSGVLLIDIGGGTTSYMLYYDGVVLAGGALAVGGDHITNDIVIGLNVPAAQAEFLKVKEGSASTNLMERDHQITIPATPGFSGRMARAATLNTIINVRMEEIFDLVKLEVEKKCPQIPLSAGVVLTGGGAFLSDIEDLGKKVFNAPCTRGKPMDVKGLPSTDESTLYAVHVGGIRYAASLQAPVAKLSVSKRLIKWFWGDSNG